MKTTAFFSLLIGIVLSATTYAQTALHVEVTKSDVTCFGQSNGKAELYIAGGQAPYAIQWNTGATAQMIENLRKGTYTVQVTDAKGTQVTETVSIAAPTPMAIMYNTPVSASVDNLNAKMNAMVLGGTPWESTNLEHLYMVRIDGKSYYENPENITPGVHQMSIEDAQGCTLKFDVNLNAHLVGETATFQAPTNGLGTIDLTVYPIHLMNQQDNTLTQAF